MATLIDAIGFLKDFGVYQTIFPWLLVTAGVYALLTKYETLGKNAAINFLVSAVVGFLFISITRAVTFLNMLLPIMTILLILVVLALLVFTFIGVKQETIAGAFTDYTAPWLLMLLLFVSIIFVILAQVFPESSLMIQNPVLAQKLGISAVPANATAQQQASAYLFTQIMQVMLSPPILSLIVLFVVFAIAAYFITSAGAKSS